MKTRQDVVTALSSTIPKKNKHQLTIKIPDKTSLETKIEKYKRDILGFRTTNEQLFVQNHMIKSYKTAVLINRDKLPEGMVFSEENKLNEIPSHRPIKKITKKSHTDSPVEVQTPKGTTLPRVARFGILSLFSNEPNAKPIVNLNTKKTLENETQFYSSEPFDSILEIDSNTKKQQATITHRQLEKRRSEDLKNHFRRSISQNKIMAKPGVIERKGSATDYADATMLFDKDLRWEWLHLVAHMIAGTASQESDNLVAGTAYANTEMMFAEATLNYLARVYPDGFHLSVKANLIPGTHIGTSILYIIKTTDFDTSFEFNTQTPNRPHINYQGYFNYLIEELVRYTHFAKKNKSKEEQQIMTYSKNEIKHDDIPIVTDIKNLAPKFDDKNRPRRKVIIDTETTGLFVDQGDRVCEIAGVEIIDGKPTGKEFKKIINPERSIPKMLNYKGIHHITDAVVKGKPTFREIANEFCQFIKNAEIIGHNLPFDLTMLENELKLAKRPETLIDCFATDTLADAQKWLPKNDNPELHSHKLDDLCDYFNIDSHERDKGHDALIDARLTGELYLHLHKDANKHQLFPHSNKNQKKYSSTQSTHHLKPK